MSNHPKTTATKENFARAKSLLLELAHKENSDAATMLNDAEEQRKVGRIDLHEKMVGNAQWCADRAGLLLLVASTLPTGSAH
jgi:hypothetical protein